jgi:hypothetical protein
MRMTRITKGLVLAGIIVLCMSGGAVAAKKMTGTDIINGSLTGKEFKKGSIGENRLSQQVQRKLNTTVSGSAAQQGVKGDKGDKGDSGAPGRDGFNPSVAVLGDGDAGWKYVGFSGPTRARITGGELRLPGGFDGSTPVGSIGMSKAYDNLPIGVLSALRYSFHVNKRPNDLSAPALLVTVMNANTGTSTGFANLVFEPYNNLTTSIGQPYLLDAMSGQWWATRDLNAGTAKEIKRQQTVSFGEIASSNQNAVIVGISLTNGGSSSNTIPVDDFDAGADELVVGITNQFTRYDFGG